MKYKDYTAKVSLDEDQEIFHGEVLGLTDVITFQGTTPKELKIAFQESVDDYLAYCKELGDNPEKPLSGRFMVRMTSELHRDCTVAAKLSDQSLNSWVVSTLRSVVDQNAEAGLLKTPILSHSASLIPRTNVGEQIED
ncbi:MAG: toxin-antitoxin system HicB family antitoxin [Blastopirellula sp.]|nr:MAG: toxin-antitoxin system HicB family antitoxin [Blastopirellula sp.]